MCLQSLAKQRQSFWENTVLPFMEAAVCVFPGLADRADACRAAAGKLSLEKMSTQPSQFLGTPLVVTPNILELCDPARLP